MYKVLVICYNTEKHYISKILWRKLSIFLNSFLEISMLKNPLFYESSEVIE